MKIFQALRIKTHRFRFFLTPSHLFGYVSFIAAFYLYFIDMYLIAVPLALFVMVCFVAPFFPTIGYFLPVIRKGNSDKNAVAITFDDGPDPRTTPTLLNLLSKFNFYATFFVTGEKANNHPELIRNIISNGHSIGNHSYSHDHFIMLKSVRRLREEIELAQNILKKQDITTFAFRPPVGITNPKLYKILDTNGLYCVNYSCRALDAGNRKVKHISGKILKRVKANDIIMLHDTFPKTQNDFTVWLNELDKLISGIMNKGLTIHPLSTLIGKQVMITK